MNQYNSRFPLHRPPPPPQFLQNGDPQSFASRPQMWFQPRQPFQNTFPVRGQCPQAPFSVMNNTNMSNNMRSPPGNNCGYQSDVFGYNLNSRPNHTDFRMQQQNLNSNNTWRNGQHNSNRPNNHVDGSRFNPKQNSSNRNQWKNKSHNNKNNNNQPNTQKKKKNKPKVDKRELAENNKYFCDTCDRGYKDEDKYQEHVNSHVKCTFEECSYIAHPKLVRLHVNLQHKSGLAKKIWLLESQEDIDKWRNERKRNYPTEENVKKKMLIKTEREARGEVIETKQFGKMQKRGKRDRFNKQKERKEIYQAQARKRTLQESSGDGHVLGENDSCNPEKIQKNDFKPNNVTEENKQGDGDPLSILADRSELELDKDDNKGVSLTGGLGTLMASYSDSDNNDENITETNNNSKSGQNTCSHIVQKDSNEDCNVENSKRNRKRQRGRKNKKMENGPIKLRKSTLLEKLLAPDIRHERNVILQCVHYIVKNDFFRNDDDDKTFKESETKSDVEALEY